MCPRFLLILHGSSLLSCLSWGHLLSGWPLSAHQPPSQLHPTLCPDPNHHKHQFASSRVKSASWAGARLERHHSEGKSNMIRGSRSSSIVYWSQPGIPETLFQKNQKQTNKQTHKSDSWGLIPQTPPSCHSAALLHTYYFTTLDQVLVCLCLRTWLLSTKPYDKWRHLLCHLGASGKVPNQFPCTSGNWLPPPNTVQRKLF